MPNYSPSPLATRLRLSAAALLAAMLATVATLAAPSGAAASGNQIAIFQSGNQLLSDPVPTVARIRELGANTIRLIAFWDLITRNPRAHRVPAHFQAADPGAYPAANWAPYDAVIKDAAQAGIAVDLTIAGGAPAWADGPGVPPKGYDPHFAWKPNAREYGQFVHAVGVRYDGHYRGLPAVHFWALWNEPNFGEDLGPQAINGSTVSFAPTMYRHLVNAGWNALRATGHGHDTILIGEFAARGSVGPVTRHHPQGLPGNYGQTKPLAFIRTLYCLDGAYRQLRGSAARSVGCPATAGGSRRFRAVNPGLFAAGGVGDHPYPKNLSPVSDGRGDPDFAAFPDLGHLGRVLDRVQRAYGSRRRLSIYNDEYGYITSPPAARPYVSPSTAAYYLNWAEYLSWRNRRIKSYMQYLLTDPSAASGGFTSGLLTFRGVPKPTYDAYRLPLYIPQSNPRAAQRLEVWGDVRPAQFAQLDTGAAQSVQIQLQAHPGAPFRTVTTVAITNPRGYFDTRMTFASSGMVRLSWTYPQSSPFLPVSALGATVHSRAIKISAG